jgi:hypothetical protein
LRAPAKGPYKTLEQGIHLEGGHHSIRALRLLGHPDLYGYPCRKQDPRLLVDKPKYAISSDYPIHKSKEVPRVAHAV